MVAIAPPLQRQVIGPGLGASEVAAALGLNPYRSPLALWEEKIGEREPFKGNEFTEWGLLVEPALLGWYRDHHTVPGEFLVSPEESLYHPTIEWARATPDAIVYDQYLSTEPRVARRAVQAKNASFWSGRRWDKGAPDEVQLQCQWEMFVTSLPRVDAVAALGGMPPEVQTIYRDDALIADLLAAARKFWALVESRTPPPIDHTVEWAERFAKQIKRPGFVVPATPLTDDLAARLRDARAQARAAERLVEQLKNELRAVMGDAGADAIDTYLGKLTWRASQGKTSWKAVAGELARRLGMPGNDLDSLADATRGAESRTFNVPREWDKEH